MVERMNNIYPGMKIGRWSVTSEYITTETGERKWLCHCVCGTERYVLERSLRHGGSLSCGCLRKENANKVNSYDLTGQIFGDLYVIEKAENQRKNGGVWWRCKCSCGNFCDVSATLLVNGRKTHCGCKSEKKYFKSDLTNKKFNRLTALYPTEKRSYGGNVVWHCLCECGNEVDVSYNDLMYNDIQSCGCKKIEHNAKLKDNLTHIAGTTIDKLKNNRTPVNNTSGVKGVYFIKGKWVAKIVFQQKAYYLGTYENINDAIDARKNAEETIFKGTVDHYNKWKIKADEDPRWGTENPISIKVDRKSENNLSISFLPII